MSHTSSRPPLLPSVLSSTFALLFSPCPLLSPSLPACIPPSVPPPSQNAKEETAAALEEARQASEEVRALRSLTARILLTPEEKEEVVLKRCWLARYWALAAKHGGW